MPEYRTPPCVFVVDDETVVSTTLAMILRNQGFNARAFSDPVEALQAACETPPDLVITDVAMPVLSGIDLAIQLRELCPDCKVLLFSGFAATADVLQGARAKGHEFELLSKPIHPTEILKKVRSVFDGSRLLASH